MSGWCDHVNTGIPIHGKVSKRISRRMGGASRWSCSEKFIAFHLSGILWELGIPPADPCFPRCLHLYSSSSSRFFHPPSPSSSFSLLSTSTWTWTVWESLRKTSEFPENPRFPRVPGSCRGQLQLEMIFPSRLPTLTLKP